MPRNTRPVRTPVSCSLPPGLADRLIAESEIRILAPSAIIERALVNLFAEIDDVEASAVLPTHGAQNG